jgi:hypothetical protein
LAAIASDVLHCNIALQEGKDITRLNLNFPSINYTSSSNQVSSHLQLLATLSLQEAALLLSEGDLAQNIADSFTTTTAKRAPSNNADGDDDHNKEEEQEEEEEEEMQPVKKKMKQSVPVNSDDDNIENTPPSKKLHRYLKTILTQGKPDGAVRNPLPLFPSTSSSSLPTTKNAPDDADDLKINAASITTTTIIQPRNNPETTTTTTTNNNNNNPTEQQQPQQQRQESPRTTRWRQFSDGRCIVNITPRVLDQAEISLPLSIRSGLFRHITINNYKRGRIILHCTPPPTTPSSSSSAAALGASQLPVQEYSAEIYRRPVRTDAVLRYFRPMVQGLNLAANDVLVFNACSHSSITPSEGAVVDDDGGGFHNATTKLNHFSVQVFQASSDQAKEHIAWVRQQLAPSTGTTNNGSSRREKLKSTASGSHSNASAVPEPATRVLPIRAVRFASEVAITTTTITTATVALATCRRRHRGQTRAHSLITIHDTDTDSEEDVEEEEEEATSPGPSSSPSVSPTAQPRRRGRGGRKKADNKEDPDFLPKCGVKIAVGEKKRKKVLRSNSTITTNKTNTILSKRSTHTSNGGGGGGTELRPQRLRLSSVTYNSSMYVLDGPPSLSLGPPVTKSAGGGTGGIKNRRPGRPSTILKKNKGGTAAASTAAAGAAATVAVDLFNKKEKLYNFDSSSSSVYGSIQSPTGFSRKRGTSTSTSDDDSTSGNSDDDDDEEEEEEEEDSFVDVRGHHLLPPSAVNAVYRGGAKTRGLSAMEAMKRMRRKQSNPQQAPCE